MGGRSSKGGVRYDVVDPGHGGNRSPSPPQSPARLMTAPAPCVQFPAVPAEQQPIPELLPASGPIASASSSPPSSPSSSLPAPEASQSGVLLQPTFSFPSLRDWGSARIPISGHLSSPSVRLCDTTAETPPPSLIPPPPQTSPWAPVQQAPPPPLPPGWSFAIDPASGFPFFFNHSLQLSQWEDPRGRGWGLPDPNSPPPPTLLPGLPNNPLDWPLPPGWELVQDPVSGTTHFVNYDAQLLLETDPRILIATSISQLTPASYPPPWTDVPLTLPTPAPQPHWLPSPPPPIPGRHPNLWWKLRHPHGRPTKPQPSPASRTNFLLLDHALADNKKHHHHAANKKHHHHAASISISSSSSSSSDDDGDDGGNQAGVLGETLVLGAEAVESREDGDGGGNEGGVLGEALIVGDEAVESEDGDVDEMVAAVSGMEAVIAYGGAGPRDLGGGGRGGGSGGSGVSSGSGRREKRRGGRWRWRFCEHDGGFLDEMVLFWQAMDSLLQGLFLALLCVGCLPVLWVFAFFGSRCRRHLSLVRWKIGGDGGLGGMIKCKPSWKRISRAVTSVCVKLQAGYFEHICEHQAAKLRVLTAADGAAPLLSSLPRREREVTIVTQASADRLSAIKAMASSWGGAVCVAVHVRTRVELEEVYPQLCSLHAQIEERGMCRLHISIAMEDGFRSDGAAKAALYPVNSMRNVALKMATTELVFLLDADFVPSPGLHQSLTADEGCFKALLREVKEEKKLFVVAAFECGGRCGMPSTFEELRESWLRGLARGFHCGHFPRGHQPTDYDTFFNTATCNAYSVQYQEFYEPYVICARELVPCFDERFRGYGLNKISHAYHCASSGMSFCVLPRHYLWELPHPRSKAWSQTFGFDKDPRQMLRVHGLYRRFKAELASKKKKRSVGVYGVKVMLARISVSRTPRFEAGTKAALSTSSSVQNGADQ